MSCFNAEQSIKMGFLFAYRGCFWLKSEMPEMVMFCPLQILNGVNLKLGNMLDPFYIILF